VKRPRWGRRLCRVSPAAREAPSRTSSSPRCGGCRALPVASGHPGPLSLYSVNLNDQWLDRNQDPPDRLFALRLIAVDCADMSPSFRRTWLHLRCRRLSSRANSSAGWISVSWSRRMHGVTASSESDRPCPQEPAGTELGRDVLACSRSPLTKWRLAKCVKFFIWRRFV